MQQMAGNMGLLNPFVFNQFGNYGTYTQVGTILRRCVCKHSQQLHTFNFSVRTAKLPIYAATSCPNGRHHRPSRWNLHIPHDWTTHRPNRSRPQWIDECRGGDVHLRWELRLYVKSYKTMCVSFSASCYLGKVWIGCQLNEWFSPSCLLPPSQHCSYASSPFEW